MTDFESLWLTVEEAPPEDPTALLVCADWIQDRRHPKDTITDETGGEATWEQLEFALRWCAGRNRRPYKRTDVLKPRWGWVRQVDYRARKKKFSKAQLQVRWAAILPPVLAAQMMGLAEWDSWTKSLYAYDELAVELDRLLQEVIVPDFQLPAPKITQLPGVAPCQECGIVFSQTKQTCPVCKHQREE